MGKHDAQFTTEQGDELVTVTEAARRLGVSTWKIYQWIEEGKVGPAFKSSGFPYPRYNWTLMQKEAAWKPEEGPQTQAS